MSKPTIRHYGRIVNGRKEYYNPTLYKQQMDSLEGQEFEEVIKKRFHKVSTDQHNFYRGAILGTIIQHDAFIYFDKPDDIHEDVIAPRFLGYIKTVTINNKTEEIKHVKSTATLSKEEMSEFIDKVINWLAMEFGIVILSPEQYYLSLHTNNNNL
jgi:hypothetical protein